MSASDVSQRVVFCGTGAFGAPALRALAASRRRPALVVTQPDRPAGRRREPKPSPIKLLAEELGLPLFQPEKLRAPEATARLREAAPDLIVVVSYGQILRREVLGLPRLGCVNLHGSALPRWRGASPVAAAIAAGDPIAGTAVMIMDEGLDTGPVLAVETTPVFPDDDAATLHDRLAALGGRLLILTLDAWEAGEIRAQPQDDAKATVCRTLSRDDARLDWTRPAVELERRVRAMRPWPGAWTEARRVDGAVYELGIVRAAVAEGTFDAAPTGTVVVAEGEKLTVACGAGALALLAVKPAGKAEMDAGAFLRGRRLAVGDRCA